MNATNAIYDVYSHPAGAALEASVAEALRGFRARHQCEPVAVWLSPKLPAAAVDGLEVKRGEHMSPWYVYLELPGARQPALALGLEADEDALAVDEPADVAVELRQLALF